jgi:transcriptional regulator with XRE-family HTH domain
MADLTTVVSQNVRGERARRGWRQTDLAKRLEWSIGMVSDTESGKRRVGLADMPRLCRAFEVPLVDMLRGADPEDLAALGL